MISYWGVDHGSEVSKAQGLAHMTPRFRAERQAKMLQDTLKGIPRVAATQKTKTSAFTASRKKLAAGVGTLAAVGGGGYEIGRRRELAKAMYYSVPTTRGEQRREKARRVGHSAVGAGLMSGGLTAALNANRGTRSAMKAGGQMVGVGALLGGGISAATPSRKTKFVRSDRG